MLPRILIALLIAVCLLLGLCAPSRASSALPPHWKQWARTCAAEQPVYAGYKGNRWLGIAWNHDGSGVTFPGGCGFTVANWDDFKPKGAPKRMSMASPAQQLWACYRIYTHFLRVSGSHRYAATVWDANRNILHWYGFTEETW